MSVHQLHQQYALGVTLTELLQTIYDRNKLRAAHHLPRLNVPTELTKAIEELVQVRLRAFDRAHDLSRRFHEKFYCRQRRLYGADYRLNGWISHMALASRVNACIWRLFSRLHWRELEVLEGWARKARHAMGEQTFISLLQQHVKM